MTSAHRFLALLSACILAPAAALAAGPYGHTILAEKTIQEIRSGATPTSAELRRLLDDPDCRRSFRGGAIAPDLAEEVHYGKTGELARNLVATARQHEAQAARDRDPAAFKRAQRELAFAYGWMSHLAADVEIHPKVNGLTGDAWSHNTTAQKAIHAAREAQLSAYLEKLYPAAANNFDVSVPYEFMASVMGTSDARLRQAMVVLKGKASAELVARSKVILSPAQLEAIWGGSVRSAMSDGRDLMARPDSVGNWDMDAGGKMSTEEFESWRNLVLKVCGGKLPPGWGAHYVDWYRQLESEWSKLKGMSEEQRLARVREIVGAAKPSAGSKPAPPKKDGRKLLTKREYYPDRKVKEEYTYYQDANGQVVRVGMDRMWHPNGKLSDEVEMVAGLIHGVWKRYYDTGELMCEETYVKGISNGPLTRFHRNGKKSEYGVTVKGNKDGVWTTWYDDGVKEGTDEYINGGRIRGKSHRWGRDGRELQLAGDW